MRIWLQPSQITNKAILLIGLFCSGILPLAAQEPDHPRLQYLLPSAQVWHAEPGSTLPDAQAALFQGKFQPTDQLALRLRPDYKTWIWLQLPAARTGSGWITTGTTPLDEVILHAPGLWAEGQPRGLRHPSLRLANEFPHKAFELPAGLSPTQEFFLEVTTLSWNTLEVYWLSSEQYEELLLTRGWLYSLATGGIFILVGFLCYHGLHMRREWFDLALALTFSGLLLSGLAALLLYFGSLGCGEACFYQWQKPAMLLTLWFSLLCGILFPLLLYSVERRYRRLEQGQGALLLGLTALTWGWLFLTPLGWQNLTVLLLLLTYLNNVLVSAWALWRKIPFAGWVLFTQLLRILSTVLLAMVQLQLLLEDSQFIRDLQVYSILFSMTIAVSLYVRATRLRLLQLRLAQQETQLAKEALESLQSDLLQRVRLDTLRSLHRLQTRWELLRPHLWNCREEQENTSPLPDTQSFASLSIQLNALHLLTQSLPHEPRAVQSLPTLLNQAVSELKHLPSPTPLVQITLDSSLPRVHVQPTVFQSTLSHLLRYFGEHQPQHTLIIRAYARPEQVTLWFESLPASLERENSKSSSASSSIDLAVDQMLAERLLEQQGLTWESSTLGQQRRVRILLPTPPASAEMSPETTMPQPKEHCWCLLSSPVEELPELAAALQRWDIQLEYLSDAAQLKVQLSSQLSGPFPLAIFVDSPTLLLLSEENTSEFQTLQLNGTTIPLLQLGGADIPEQWKLDGVLSVPVCSEEISLLVQQLRTTQQLQRRLTQQHALQNLERRRMLVELLKQSLEVWDESVQKGKVELASESGLWKVHLDYSRGVFRSRTFESYLHLETIPQHPRWKPVQQTALFVAESFPQHYLSPQLIAKAQELPLRF